MLKFTESRDDLEPVSVIRRLAAMFYDFILCISLMMVTTGCYMIMANLILGGDTYKNMNDSGQSIHDPFLSSTLFITLYVFFGFFWTKNGQTLGMQVWHIRVQNRNNTSISWRQALMRFFMGGISWLALGIGHLWPLIDNEKRSWQCIFSGTELVKIPKKIKK
ncbi:MAG: RDD family protein [Oleiphilus sp.]